MIQSKTIKEIANELGTSEYKLRLLAISKKILSPKSRVDKKLNSIQQDILLDIAVLVRDDAKSELEARVIMSNYLLSNEDLSLITGKKVKKPEYFIFNSKINKSRCTKRKNSQKTG